MEARFLDLIRVKSISPLSENGIWVSYFLSSKIQKRALFDFRAHEPSVCDIESHAKSDITLLDKRTFASFACH